MPEYPGGKDAFIKFIKDNLKYPEEAIKKKIEGDVHVSFEVDHYGRVSNVRVLKGIGAGCNEEAIRLVEMLEYGEAKNRGVRVKSSHKIKINFKINKETKKQVQLQYNVVVTKKEPQKQKEVIKPKTRYNYTIKY